jgi:hypothetical protein
MDRRAARRRGGTAAAMGLLALAGGCAQRSVQTGPDGAGAVTWALVGITAAAAVGLVAALALPTAGPRRLAPVVLAAETGLAAVGGALLVGAALRNRWLLDRAADQEQALSLVRLSDLDGRQASFFYVLAGLLAVLAVLVTVVLGLSTRFAADDDPVERGLATGVLALQCIPSAVAWGLIAEGWRGPGVGAAALALPVLAAGAVSCWPRRGEEHPASATTDP